MPTFYADISEFQSVLDSRYPYPVVAFRVDNGGRLDFHASANWAHARSDARIHAVIGYVVFQPGQRGNILRRVKALFGPTPPPKLALMIDMESGSQFAGRGNHSAEANGLAADFAAYLGSQKRVIGYANQYDFRSNWPTRPSWLKLVTASYGSQNPGTFGWQFYGGVPNPRPAGYPGSCPPFGSNVDLNAIQLPLADVLSELDLENTLADFTASQKAQIAEADWHAQITNTLNGQPRAAYQFLQSINEQCFKALQLLAAQAAEIAAIKADVEALKPKVVA